MTKQEKLDNWLEAPTRPWKDEENFLDFEAADRKSEAADKEAEE